MVTVPIQTLPWAASDVHETRQIYPGITFNWLADGKIACFTVSTVAREAVDAWLAASAELTQVWPAEQPYLAIQDVAKATMTPYIRQRSAETVAMTPRYLKGRSAVILPRTVFNEMIRLYVTVDLARKNRNVARNVFFTRDAAVAWLLKHSNK